MLMSRFVHLDVSSMSLCSTFVFKKSIRTLWRYKPSTDEIYYLQYALYMHYIFTNAVHSCRKSESEVCSK